MASRKQKKAKVTAAVSTPNAAQDQAEQASATASGSKKKAAKKRARSAVAKRRGPGRLKGSKNRPKAGVKSATKRPARKSGRRRRYTPAEKANILAVARSEGLTGAQVARKFGVSSLSYYTWRRKAGGGRKGKRNVGRPEPAGKPSSLVELIRSEVRAQLRQFMPSILENAIGDAVTASLGMSRKGQ